MTSTGSDVSDGSRLMAVTLLTLVLVNCTDRVVSEESLGHNVITDLHLSDALWSDFDDQHDDVNLISHDHQKIRRNYRSSNASHVQPEMTSSDPTATGRQRRLPNAIIIGVKKCGTRALLEFLRAHPDVRAPGPEVHFFDRHYDKGLNWYRSRMPMTSPGQLTIEKTPSYFVTPGVAERVYNMSRDIRLLVVVRDPVTRARSDFTQAASKRRRRCLQQSRLDVPHCGLERHPDARARRATFERRVFADKQQEKIDSSWSAINIGLYDRHLRHWLDWFPRHQLHFVHGEQLISDPAGQLRHVQHFLGLRTLVDREHFHFNATKGFPCVRRSRGSRGETVQCLGKTKGRHHPSVDGKVLVKLRDFYRPHNRRFYSLTGINFGWD